MSESLSNWLALREPSDHKARSVALTQAIAELLALHTPLQILDLATGTGSNVRYLAPRLPVPQRWLVVDRDPALLREVPKQMSRGQIETRCMELGALDAPEIFARRHLVTASALLDLVSEDWLRALAAQCRATGAAVLFALTYNGQSRCLPVEPEDDTVRDLLNRHQRANDKGFGRAAGPDALDCAERAFAAVGYQVRREPSDWILPPDLRALQRRLIEGWAEAAVEMAPERSAMIRDWLARRVAHVESARSHITVGHEDLAAWLR